MCEVLTGIYKAVTFLVRFSKSISVVDETHYHFNILCALLNFNT